MENLLSAGCGQRSRSAVGHCAFDLLGAVLYIDACLDQFANAIHVVKFGATEKKRAFDEKNLDQFGESGAGAVE